MRLKDFNKFNESKSSSIKNQIDDLSHNKDLNTNSKKVQIQEIGIVRNIISSLLKVDARDIELCGMIEHDFIPLHDAGHSWSSEARKHKDTIWGYSFKKGLVLFKDINKSHRFSNNGDISESEGETLTDYLARNGWLKEFEFIIVRSEGTYDANEGYFETRLYKTANFANAWETIQADDIARWKRFLND